VSDIAANTAAIEALVAEMQKKASKEAADAGSTGSSSRLGGGGAYLTSEQLQDRLKIEQQLVSSEQDRLDVGQKLAKIEYERALQWEGAFKDSLEEGVELTAAQVREWEEISAVTEKAEKKLKGLTKAQADLNAEQAKGAQGAKTLKNNLFGLSGGLSKILEIVPTTTDAFKSFGKEMFNWRDIQKNATAGLLKIFDLFMQVAFAADEAQSKFRQNTGASKEFNNNISAVRNNLHDAGVTFDEAGKSMEALYGGMSSFTRVSDGMQTKLAGVVGVYDQLGVSMDVTTGIMDHAVQSLGYDAQGSMDLVKQLDDTAVSLGKNISDVFADFASASKKLSFYGTDMINVFRKLEMQSKDTGLSIDEILGLTEQFDTFEGAGKAVGKLNALLGGPYLNSIDMLNATEAERMEMMKEAMDMSGTMFSDLSKYEQKAFAAAMGSDVDTLRKAMMGLTSEEEEQIKVQKKAEERAKAAKSAMEGLTLQLQALIQDNKPLLKSILEGVRAFTEWIAKMQETGEFAKNLKRTVGGLIGIKVAGWLWSIGKVVVSISKGLFKFGSFMINFFGKGGTGLKAIRFFGTKMGAILGPVWTFLTVGITGTISGIAAGIFNTIGAVMGFVDVFRDGMDGVSTAGDAVMLVIKSIGGALGGIARVWGQIMEKIPFVNKLMNSDMGASRTFDYIFKLGDYSAKPANPQITDGAVLKGGQVTTFADNDTLLAGRPGGGLARALGEMMGTSMTGASAALPAMSGTANPILGFLSTLANAKQERERAEIMQMYGPLLKSAITDPIVQALGGGTGDGAGGINVKVYIGQEEVDATVVKALNSPQGRSAMLPWSSGAPR